MHVNEQTKEETDWESGKKFPIELIELSKKRKSRENSNGSSLQVEGKTVLMYIDEK